LTASLVYGVAKVTAVTIFHHQRVGSGVREETNHFYTGWVPLDKPQDRTFLQKSSVDLIANAASLALDAICKLHGHLLTTPAMLSQEDVATASKSQGPMDAELLVEIVADAARSLEYQ
jgi:hypothetical protein